MKMLSFKIKRVACFSSLVLLLVPLIILATCSRSAIAIGGANEGTSPSGGSCSHGASPWWDTCFGYSWQAYKVTKDLPSENTVTFHYTKETGGATYLHYCKKGQTLYNYGFEVYNGYSTSLGSQVSTQVNKDGRQASWRSGGALGAYTGINNTTSDYLTADGYADQKVVKSKYEKMLAYDAAHGTNYAHNTKWETVGYFCWDEEAESNKLTAYAAVNGSYDSNTGTRMYIKSDGTITSNRNDSWNISTTVKYGNKATVNVGGFDSGKYGYLWDSWGSSCATSERDGRKCTKQRLTSDTDVYAYYNMTLTAYANSLEKDKNGNYIKLNGGDYIARSSVGYNSDASVTSANFNPSGYSWYRWGDSCDRESSRECIRKKMTGNKNVYAYYIKNSFKGRASVTSGGRTETTGFVSVDKKDKDAALLKIDCPESGCRASFTLSLMSEAGSGETTYTVYENGHQKAGYIQRAVKPVATGTDVGNFTVDMQAGDLVCYKMEFNTVPVDGKKATVEACAIAEANKDSDIDIKLRDRDSSVDYQDWRDDYVYAKPNDTVEFIGNFEPRYQYLADKKPSVTNIILDEESEVSKNGLNNDGKSILDVFNANMDPGWNNAFSIVVKGECKDTFFPPDDENRLGNIGSYGGNYNYLVATADDMGKIEAKSKTNNCDMAKNTPKSVSFAYNAGNRRFEATVNNSPIDDVVNVYVPYNFQNKTEVTTEGDKVVYAGESEDFNIAVETHPRTNPLTNGTYATVFSNARLKVRFCDEKEISCYGEEEVDISGLDVGRTYSTKVIDKNVRIKLNIPDTDAGSVVCLRSMMYPADSGNYDNWQNSEGSGTWTEWSDKKCFKVAKRPSLQVWGGGVYSAGMINMMPSAKNNLYGYESNYPYRMTGQGNHRVFSSWAELSLAANGNVSGLASGAGTGYAQTKNAEDVENGKTLELISGNFGGSAEGTNTDYCLRSTLSFANTDCNKAVGSLGGGLQSKVSSDKKALMSKFIGGNGSDYKLYSGSETEGIDDFYGEIEEEDGIEKKKVTRAIVSDGDFTISGNIKYSDNEYASLEDVPKIIIYAKNDINIKCDVTRIDAVLIAENNINTCSDSDDINAKKNSKQLKINGSVISNTLTLNRTYGAAKGVNSVIPAEIVNYDTSLYLWANKQADVATSGKMTEAYIGELAPRY